MWPEHVSIASTTSPISRAWPTSMQMPSAGQVELVFDERHQRRGARQRVRNHLDGESDARIGRDRRELLEAANQRRLAVVGAALPARRPRRRGSTRKRYGTTAATSESRARLGHRQPPSRLVGRRQIVTVAPSTARDSRPRSVRAASSASAACRRATRPARRRRPCRDSRSGPSSRTPPPRRTRAPRSRRDDRDSAVPGDRGAWRCRTQVQTYQLSAFGSQRPRFAIRHSQSTQRSLRTANSESERVTRELSEPLARAVPAGERISGTCRDWLSRS